MNRRAVIVVALVGLAGSCAMPRHQVQTAVSFERQAEAALAKVREAGYSDARVFTAG